MARIKFELGGVTVTRNKFKEFPSELAAKAQAVLEARATTVAASIASAYPVKSGRLAASMEVRSQPRKTKARVLIVNKARYAVSYDFGHPGARRTKKGAYRGTQPAQPTFVPRIMAARVDLVPRIAALLRSEGLTVTGG